MERDVEAKFRERFALIDKSDVDQLAEAQKVYTHLWNWKTININQSI